MLSLSRSGVRHALTVVMFHRVIDPGDADFAQADPVYTVSAPLFEQQLGSFVIITWWWISATSATSLTPPTGCGSCRSTPC
jgi:hypothetical protein